MRLYHYKSGDSFAFNEALTDYLAASGLSAPASVLRGDPPAMDKGPFGKPYFCEPGLEGVYFSRSHTQGYEIVCFSEGEIGADCENTEARRGFDSRYSAIARRCFTVDEQEYIGSGAEALMRFFEVWTAKEAYMKYTGRGFAEGFRSFSVFCLPGLDIAKGRLEEAPQVVYSVCTARAI